MVLINVLSHVFGDWISHVNFITFAYIFEMVKYQNKILDMYWLLDCNKVVKCSFENLTLKTYLLWITDRALIFKGTLYIIESQTRFHS